MKKTPLKQLIGEMQDLKKTKIFNNSFKAIDDCIDLAYAKLEIEKEQIENSFNEGWLQCNIYGLPEKSRKHFETSEKYYNETYTQSSE